MTNRVKPKLSYLALSLLLGMAGTTVVQAAETSSFEFHGYFRSGVLFGAKDDFKRANYPGQKETLGRLGLEADNDYKANLVSNWNFDDGRNFKIHFGIGSQGKEAGYSSSADGFDAGITNGFVELNGVTPSGTVWAGKREYGKQDNYIFMTDFFYTDMSGLGLGVQGLGIGSYEYDFAYIASDRYDESIDRWADTPAQVNNNETNLNNLMHAIHLGTSFGDLKVSALLKAMPDNWDRRGYEWAETGFDLTLAYKMHNFFGLVDNGFSHIILQAGKGLGSGNLLGGTITDYNGFKPGSLHQGQHDDWGPAGDASYLLTQVAEDDTSTRMLLWGGYTFDNGIGFFPALQGQYNDMAVDSTICYAGPIDGRRDRCTGDYNYWLSAMARITVPMSQHFYVQGEVGHVHNNWGGSTWNQSKISVAPTLILPTAYGVNPEIRLLASYVTNSWTYSDDDGQPSDDLILGFQADLWW
ncbi:MAG: carbohydrate porin [Plesiomonas sp.]